MRESGLLLLLSEEAEDAVLLALSAQSEASWQLSPSKARRVLRPVGLAELVELVESMLTERVAGPAANRAASAAWALLAHRK